MKISSIILVVIFLAMPVLVEAQANPEVYSQPTFNFEQKPTQDFSVQVVDYQPKVIRSDLIEEQNNRVPVYAQLRLTQNNPLIEVGRINSLTPIPSREIEGIEYPTKFVSGLTFIRNLDGSDMNNPGYILVNLVSGIPEKDLPDELAIPIKATINYDLAYVPGVRVEYKTVEPFPSPLSDQEWLNNQNRFSFWNKNGFVRVTEIDGERVTGQIYDGRNIPISSFVLDRIRPEAIFTLPSINSNNFEQKGQGKIILESVKFPEIRTRLNINLDGQNIKNEIAEGEEIYEGSNWVVEKIFVENKNIGTGIITLNNRLTGEQIKLELKEREEIESQELISEINKVPEQEVKQVKEEVKISSESKVREEIVLAAEKRIGDSYKLGEECLIEGGEVDCSGLVYAVYKTAQINLKSGRATANTYYQDYKNNKVESEKWEKGDLCFYNNDQDSAIDHVGIYAGKDQGTNLLIHASSSRDKVVKDTKFENWKGFLGCYQVTEVKNYEEEIIASVHKEYELAIEKTKLLFSFIPTVSAQNEDEILLAYNEAVELYWKIIFEFGDLEISENNPKYNPKNPTKTWGLLALEQLEQLSITFSSEKSLKEEYKDLSIRARSELAKTYNYLEANYPENYELKQEEIENFYDFDLSNAIASLNEVKRVGGLVFDQSVSLTLTKIIIPDISEKYSDVKLDSGEFITTITNGDYLIKNQAKEISLTITQNQITSSNGVIINKEEEGQIDNLIITYESSRIDSETNQITANIRVKINPEKKFEQRFGEGDVFLGREVRIELNRVKLISEDKSQLTITERGLNNIQGSLFIYANRLAKLKITPNSQGKIAETEFSLHIGIEKRLIQISPEEARRQAKFSRETAEKIKSISDSMGKTIETWRSACFATSTALFTKNFIQGFQGQGFARDKVMTAYKEFCEGQIGADKPFKNFHECALAHESGIEESTSIIINAKERSDEILKSITQTQEEIQTLDIDEFSKTLKEEYDTDLTSSLADLKRFQENSGQTVLQPSQAKEILFQLEITKNAKQAENEIIANSYQKFSEAEIKDLDITGKAFGNKVNEFENIWQQANSKGEIKQTTNGVQESISKEELFRQYLEVEPSKGDLGSPQGGVLVIDNTEYIFVNEINEWKLKKVERDQESGVYSIKIDDQSNKRIIRLKNKCTLKEEGSLIRFYGSGPNKDKVYTTPFPMPQGDGSIIIQKYDSAGNIAEAVITSPTTEGNCDGPWLFVKGSEIPQSRELAYRNAVEMTKQISFNLKDKTTGRGNIAFSVFGLTRNYGIGSQKITSSGEPQCEDFMSPQDCEILFQVCDPVMCPVSRFNLGGRWEVADVVQTGLFGSLTLGMPNFPHPAVPVCLPGVRAGLQNYASILDSYAECLDDSAETGRTTGICDRIRSIYVCEMLWKEGLAIANAHGGLFDLVGKVAGVQKGGIEYLNFRESLDKVGESFNWFTSTYAAPVFTAFEARNGEEIGTSICKAAFFGRVPGMGNILSELAKPESPTQFYAFIEEIPHSNIEQSQFRGTAQSQYKVFFHIFAGEDKGVFFRTYLKDRTSLPGEPSLQILQIPNIASRGFIQQGEFVSETIDFLAPSGFKQICVEIDGREECGFGKVTTDFLFNFASDKYLTDQLDNPVKNAEECLSGSASTIPLADIPFTGSNAISDSLHGGIKSRGITRVCDANDPGKGVSNNRWKVVGTCGEIAGEEMKCWLDTTSVEQALTDVKFKEQTLQTAENTNFDFLTEQGYFTQDQSEVEIGKVRSLLLNKEYKETMSQANEVFKKSLDPQIKAEALIIIAEANKNIAINGREILEADQIKIETSVTKLENQKTQEKLDFELNINQEFYKDKEILGMGIIIKEGEEPYNIEVFVDNEKVEFRKSVEEGYISEFTTNLEGFSIEIPHPKQDSIVEVKIEDSNGKLVGVWEKIGEEKIKEYTLTTKSTIKVNNYNIRLNRFGKSGIFGLGKDFVKLLIQIDGESKPLDCDGDSNENYLTIFEDGEVFYGTSQNHNAKCENLVFENFKIDLENKRLESIIKLK